MAVDAVCSGTPSSRAMSRAMVRSLCIVAMWLPVPSNLRSMMFSSAELVTPQPAPELEKTL